jgi:hypothetical protein
VFATTNLEGTRVSTADDEEDYGEPYGRPDQPGYLPANYQDEEYFNQVN